MRTRSRPALYFADTGDGEPVLVITGWTISSAVFDAFAERLAPDFRVLTYDHRGSGRSAPWLRPVSAAMLAADAARVLDDRGVSHAHVVGLSLGAGIALEMAIRLPSRVRSLCLVGATAGGPSTSLPRPLDAIRAMGALAGDSARHGTLWPAAALFSEEFRRANPELAAKLTHPFTLHRAPPWAAAWQTLAVACFGRAGSLSQITAPTLLLHGGRDVMTPPANARLIAERIPDAELRLFDGSGHAVVLEHQEESLELLSDWFHRHAARVPGPVARSSTRQERLTRPLSLHAGAARNARDALRLAAGLLRRP